MEGGCRLDKNRFVKSTKKGPASLFPTPLSKQTVMTGSVSSVEPKVYCRDLRPRGIMFVNVTTDGSRGRIVLAQWDGRITT
jgi:hypothetical protein